MPFFAAVSAVASVASVAMGMEAASAARAAARARAKIAKLENLRTTVNVVREARAKRAEAVAGAEAMGMAPDSSALSGGLSSLEAQLFGNLDYIAKSTKLNSVANAAEIRASQYGATSAAFRATSDLFDKIPGDIWNDIPESEPQAPQQNDDSNTVSGDVVGPRA